MLFNFLTPKTTSDFFEDIFETFPRSAAATMRTDIEETDKEYVLHVELPGYTKDDIKISLKDGYLKVEASKTETKTENSTVLRKEIFAGSQSRSYYVGNIDQNLVNARFENGILMIGVPKEEMVVEDKTNYIAIE